MSRTNVLFIEYGIGFGGSVVSLSELARALESRGQYAPTVTTSQDEEILRGLLGPVRHHSFHRMLNYRTRAQYEQQMRRLRMRGTLLKLAMRAYAAADVLNAFVDSLRTLWLIRRSGADIVHINNGWSDEAIRAAHWASRPVVLHFRGFLRSKLLVTRARRSWLRSTVAQTVAISDAVAESVVAAGIPQDLVTRVYNPIRHDRYEEGRSSRDEIRRQAGVQFGETVVAIFGRVTSWKGQLEFLRAVRNIEADCPRLRVMVVGDESDSEDESYARETRALAASMRPGLVIFTGYQNRVQDFYWASDVVVHNSVEPEPFGRVVSEAMACERAVIAIAEGGPAEIITDGVDGVLVAPRDEAAMGSAIRLLYEDPALRERLGVEAARTVDRRFSDDAIASQIEDVYRRVLDHSRAR